MSIFKATFRLLAKIPGLRAVYRATPAYKAKTWLCKQQNRAATEVHERLLRDAFQSDLTVRYGPFAGMHYLSVSSCSQVLPKILGSYEEPVHPWIEEIVSHKICDLILDVGCAEGYYAVGLALRMPQVRVLAFDVDAEARERARKLILLNEVSSRVSVSTECTCELLQQCGGPSTLVFCDIEGAEDTLLDPVKAPRLKECTILVEAHDVFVPGISDRLIARFAGSHYIRMVVDYPGRLGNYDLQNSDKLLPGDLASLRDEIRPPCMRFFFLEPLSLLDKRAGTNADSSAQIR